MALGRHLGEELFEKGRVPAGCQLLSRLCALPIWLVVLVQIVMVQIVMHGLFTLLCCLVNLAGYAVRYLLVYR